MYLAMPQPLNITSAAAAGTVEKLELFAQCDTLHDGGRAEMSRASSPSSVYSVRAGPVSVSLSVSTSPSSVYSTRPTANCAPLDNHALSFHGTLHNRPRLAVPSMSMAILDANPDTAPVSRRKMPNGKYQYSIRIPERTSSKYALLDPRADAFPAPPAEMGQKGKGKEESAASVRVPGRRSSKYALLTSPSRVEENATDLGLRQVSMTWHKEVAESGSAQYTARWSGLNFEEVRSLGMSKGKGSGLAAESDMEVPAVEGGCWFSSRAPASASEKEKNGEVSMSKMWAEGKLDAGYCDEEGEVGEPEAEVSLNKMWAEKQFRASWCE